MCRLTIFWFRGLCLLQKKGTRMRQPSTRVPLCPTMKICHSRKYEKKTRTSLTPLSFPTKYGLASPSFLPSHQICSSLLARRGPVQPVVQIQDAFSTCSETQIINKKNLAGRCNFALLSLPDPFSHGYACGSNNREPAQSGTDAFLFCWLG